MKWPTALINSIARRRCVLFLGAGVSANSKNEKGKHPATWNAFLNNIILEKEIELRAHIPFIKKLINESNYLLACEVIVDHIGKNEFEEMVSEEYRKPGYKPAEIHKVIFSLDSRIVITPNIDKIYEQYANNESNSTVVVKSYFDSDLAKYLRKEDYLIIRAHGHVDDSSKMIFTHEQYSKARVENASFYNLLNALILTHTFVFIGCGINDPDIQLTLENCNFSYKDCMPHYFVSSNDSINDEMKNILLKNRNLKVLTYDNSDRTHKRLLEGLQELKVLVEQKRNELSVPQTW